MCHNMISHLLILDFDLHSFSFRDHGSRSGDVVMKFHRRGFLHLAAAAAAAFPITTRITWAEAYPSRPVHIVVGFPAGTGPDILARIIGETLSERLGQPFVVENRPGAASNIGTEAVVHAPPDGYTLLLVTSPNAANATLYEKLDFNFIRDIAPVARIVRAPFVMAVNPLVPAKAVPEFIAYAKANPGKLRMASGGIGSTPHIYGELFKMMTGVDMLHVPYRGNPISDLLAGQVEVYFAPVQEVIEYIRAGKLRALAVTTATPLDLLPGIPTVGESVPGYEASGWLGIGAPRSTPSEIIERLNEEINTAIVAPDLKTRLNNLGDTTFASSPANFGQFISDETEKWAKVIKAANIKAE